MIRICLQQREASSLQDQIWNQKENKDKSYPDCYLNRRSGYADCLELAKTHWNHFITDRHLLSPKSSFQKAQVVIEQYPDPRINLSI